MPSKWLWFLVIAVCVAVLLLGAVLSENQRIRQEMPTEETPVRPYRIIGVWEDRVAVYLPQTDMPERVYDARVSALPVEEQQKLREGIAVADSVTLAQRLEDYVS